MRNSLKLFIVLLISVVFITASGCITKDSGGGYNQTTVTTMVTTTIKEIHYNLSLGEPCSENKQCISGCCDSEKGKKKCQVLSFCTCKDLNEEGCYKEKCYWCINKCQNEPCGDCSKHRRCVIVSEGDGNVTKVEISQPVTGYDRSCRYLGFYENASGNESYCDKHEGTRIYGKCGSSATEKECVEVYGEDCCYIIEQRRSFHSPEGDDYDLWCFKCIKYLK